MTTMKTITLTEKDHADAVPAKEPTTGTTTTTTEKVATALIAQGGILDEVAADLFDIVAWQNNIFNRPGPVDFSNLSDAEAAELRELALNVASKAREILDVTRSLRSLREDLMGEKNRGTSEAVQ